MNDIIDNTMITTTVSYKINYASFVGKRERIVLCGESGKNKYRNFI